MFRAWMDSGKIALKKAALAACMLTVFAAYGRAETVTLTPASGFDTGKPALSIALLHVPHADVVLVAVAHGTDGLSLYTMQGRRTWSHGRAAHVVAPVKTKFTVYDKLDETALYDVMIGHGGARIMAGPTQTPSPVAATTLQRASLSALGPLRIEENILRSADAQVSLPAAVIAVAALKAPDQSARNGKIVATVTQSGRVDFYNLETMRNALFP